LIRSLTLLDAAMGTALRKRGLPMEALPEEWILSRPQSIAAVHASHAKAGARILLTCTFNATPNRLRTRGIEERLESLCGWSERLARSARRGLLVAGAVGPTGLVLPGRPRPSAAELREQYERPFRALSAAGVDLLWAETQVDLEEARAALAAGRTTGLPTLVTIAPVEAPSGLATLSGEDALTCLEVLASEGAAAVGVNCASPGMPVADLLAAASRRVRVPLVSKPNAGLVGKILAPRAFAEWVMEMVRAGALLVGGCCGADVKHLAALGSGFRAWR
jgi:5-methyltetrahydrofolate--homocysteine methyltransferase